MTLWTTSSAWGFHPHCRARRGAQYCKSTRLSSQLQHLDLSWAGCCRFRRSLTYPRCCHRFNISHVPGSRVVGYVNLHDDGFSQLFKKIYVTISNLGYYWCPYSISFEKAVATAPKMRLCNRELFFWSYNSVVGLNQRGRRQDWPLGR